MESTRVTYSNYAFHILTWSLLLAIPSILFYNVSFAGLSHTFFLVTSLYHIGLFYLNALFLYPRLLTKKWWWLCLPVLAALLFLSYYIKLYFVELDPSFQLTVLNKRVLFFGPVPFLLASIIFRLISDGIRRERREKEAKEEQLSAELKFLRSQISPHFIFNIMTNMISLARQKSDLLEPALIKLSELLRYMLYEAAEEKFSVESEAEYLKNYIYLQQLRFEEVNVNIDIHLEQPDCNIEPMLLIPFVENAFKHGTGLVTDPLINVFLRVKESRLLFRVHNKYNKLNTSKDKSSGIGLANIQKRLDLLYTGKYNLVINDADETYSVELKLDLSC